MDDRDEYIGRATAEQFLRDRLQINTSDFLDLDEETGCAYGNGDGDGEEYGIPRPRRGRPRKDRSALKK